MIARFSKRPHRNPHGCHYESFLRTEKEACAGQRQESAMGVFDLQAEKQGMTESPGRYWIGRPSERDGLRWDCGFDSRLRCDSYILISYHTLTTRPFARTAAFIRTNSGGTPSTARISEKAGQSGRPCLPAVAGPYLPCVQRT